MPLDPSIILQAGNPTVPLNTPVQQLQQVQAMRAMQEQRRQMNAMNELRSIYADPSSVDEGGNLTTNAMRRIMSADPETGEKVMEMQARRQNLQAEQKIRESDAFMKKLELGNDAASAGVEAYDAALESGATKEQAMELGQKAKREVQDNLANSGIFSKDEIGRFAPFDPIGDRANLMKYKDIVAAKARQAQTEATQEYREAELGETQRHHEAEEKESAEHTQIMEKRLQDSLTGGIPMDDDTLDYFAQQLNETGKIPNLGFGKTAGEARGKIMKRAAEIATGKRAPTAASEAGGATVSTQAELHAARLALGQIARTETNVRNFEGTAEKEADLIESLLAKGGAPGQVPALNRYIQSGRKEGLGDPDVAAYESAVTSFKNEYARIMSSPGGTGGVTSDAARHEAEGLINGAMTKDQIRKVIATMRKSMNNRIESITEEHKRLSDSVTNLGKPPAKTPAAAGGYKTKRDVGAAYKAGKFGKPGTPQAWDAANAAMQGLPR